MYTWKCLSTCSTIIMLLLSLGMYVRNRCKDMGYDNINNVIRFTYIKAKSLCTVILIRLSAHDYDALTCAYNVYR